MPQSAVMSVAAETAASEQDWLYIHSSPLRTAAGFVLGTVLSGALWTVAGVLAWYLI